jgi:IclR family acetate operon transcriptional repressor
MKTARTAAKAAVSTPARRRAVGRIHGSAVAPSLPVLHDDLAGSPSSLRSLELLATVARGGGKASLTRIAAALGLSKPTVHRLCGHLTEYRILVRGVQPGMFAIGPAFRKLAFDALSNDFQHGIQHGVLAKLAEEIGETCNITTLDGVEVLYLDRVEARWPLRLTLALGTRLPVHCCASGKLFLALLPAADAKRLLDRVVLDAITVNTLTSAPALARELRKIRERGYSVDNEEFILGMVAVAVPIFDGSGRICATLSVHAPTMRVSEKDLVKWVPKLQDYARKLRDVIFF